MARQVVYWLVEDEYEQGPFLTRYAAKEAATLDGFTVQGDFIFLRGDCECGCEDRAGHIVERDAE